MHVDATALTHLLRAASMRDDRWIRQVLLTHLFGRRRPLAELLCSNYSEAFLARDIYRGGARFKNMDYP